MVYLAPHLYIVKLELREVYIFIALKHSYVYLRSMSNDKKNITIFHLKFMISSAVKNRSILHRCVFVMFYHCRHRIIVYLPHGVQRRMISVDNFFRIFEIIIFCFVVAICDLVHDVETIFHLSFLLTASGNLF